MTYPLILSLHLLAAAVWTGGHLVLALTVLPRARKARSPQTLLDFAQDYEKIGVPALAVQTATGLWLAAQLAPPSHWLNLAQPVSHSIMHKLGLLLLLTLLVALHALSVCLDERLSPNSCWPRRGARAAPVTPPSRF